MPSIDDLDGLGKKILVLLLALALIPMASIGLISMMEMNRAHQQVQDEITNLSTTLNRSALNVASTDADQVQLAVALANQYNEFFKRIEAENQIVADYAGGNYQDANCPQPPGVWIAPLGNSSESVAQERSETIRSLCVPARIMEGIVEQERAIQQSYVGTDDGVLITWPYGNETLSKTAPFDYRGQQNYVIAKSKKKTVWSEPSAAGNSPVNVTCTTPIFRDGEFFGIAGMEVSLTPIYNDISSPHGRGYPFIIDNSGKIVMQPASRPKGAVNDLLASDDLSEENDTEIQGLIEEMSQGKSGFSIVGLPEGDIYVAFSPLPAVGWTLGVAYPAEDMSLPAQFIDSGIKKVAESATSGLNSAFSMTGMLFLLMFLLTGLIVAAITLRLNRRLDGQMDAIVDAMAKMSRGNFDIQLRSLDELSPIGDALIVLSRDLRSSAIRLQDKFEKLRSEGTGKSRLSIEDVKRELVPEHLPVVDGYQVHALYQSSEGSGFDFYDIFAMEDKIALSMSGVDGDGTRAAMLAVMAKALIKASSKKTDPGLAMYDLNASINEHAKGAHLKCFYGLLDPQEHTLEYVNAGFSLPFIVDSGGMVDTLGGGGIALGMLDKMDQRPTRIPLQSEDVLVLFSDGVIEALNEKGERFGIERLINLVKKHRDLSASDIVAAVGADFRSFVGEQVQDLDLALVIVKQKPDAA